MKKFITIIFVVFLLVGLCIWEQITINDYLDDIQNQSKELIEITKGIKNIQTEEISNRVEKLKSTWEQHEEVLCFFANHKDMRDLCIEIQRLRGNIIVNQYEDFTAGLQVIYHLTQDYHYIMGLSLQNVF